MKKLFLLFGIIFCIGCQTIDAYSPPLIKKIDPVVLAAQIKAQKQKEAIQEKAERVGTTISQYIAAFGNPQRKELIKGQDVYWYDGDTPIYAVFKNGRLYSRYVDQATINERLAWQEHLQDENMRRADAEKNRRLRAFQIMNGMRSHRCVTNSFGSTAYTNCN